jgi:hypothetical protein
MSATQCMLFVIELRQKMNCSFYVYSYCHWLRNWCREPKKCACHWQWCTLLITSSAFWSLFYSFFSQGLDSLTASAYGSGSWLHVYFFMDAYIAYLINVLYRLRQMAIIWTCWLIIIMLKTFATLAMANSIDRSSGWWLSHLWSLYLVW